MTFDCYRQGQKIIFCINISPIFQAERSNRTGVRVVFSLLLISWTSPARAIVKDLFVNHSHLLSQFGKVNFTTKITRKKVKFFFNQRTSKNHIHIWSYIYTFEIIFSRIKDFTSFFLPYLRRFVIHEDHILQKVILILYFGPLTEFYLLIHELAKAIWPYILIWK